MTAPAASIPCWPASGAALTLDDGVTVVPSGGAVLTYTAEIRRRLTVDRTLLTYDPSEDPVTYPDTPVTNVDVGEVVSCLDLDTRLGLFDGQTIGCAYRSAAGDNGGGLFVWYPASTTTRDAGTVFGTYGAGRWKRVYSGPLLAKWFGVRGNGTTDDTAAMQLLFDALDDATKAISFEPGKYRVTGGIYIDAAASHVLIEGSRAEIYMDHTDLVAFLGCTAFASLTVRGLHFSSSKTNSTHLDVAVYCGADVSHVRVTDCSFDRVGLQINDASVINRVAGITDVSIDGCSFWGDGTGLLYGSDLANLLDLRGIKNLSITNCDLSLTKCERLAKISGACQNVSVVGNRSSASSSVGKQAFDFYSDIQRLVFANNTFNLSGSWTAMIETKNGAVGAGAVDSEPREIAITGNQCTIDTTTAQFGCVAIYGSWGLTGETASSVSSVVVSGNLWRCADGTTALVAVRGCTDVSVSNNVLVIPTPSQYGAGLEVSNCESAVISGNKINGHVLINGASSHPGATNYTKMPERVLIDGNCIEQYGSSGAIYIYACTTVEQVKISGNVAAGNTSYASTDAIQILDCTITSLSITGNDIQKYGTNYWRASGTTAIERQKHEGNNWGPPYQLFTSGDTTPDVGGYPSWRTANVGATVITYFDGAIRGDVWMVEVADANTTIDCTSTPLKSLTGADLVPTNGDVLRCTKITDAAILVELIDV